jgi:hypothetical protein
MLDALVKTGICVNKGRKGIGVSGSSIVAFTDSFSHIYGFLPLIFNHLPR